MPAARLPGRLARHVEHQFYRTLVARNHHYSLAVVVVSSSLFVSFGLLEAALPLDYPRVAALLRYIVFPPFAVAAFFLVRLPGRRPVVVFGAHAMLILVAAAISLAIMVRESWPVSAVYFYGISIAVVYSFTTQIVGFKVASAVGVMVAFASLLSAGASPAIPGEWVGVASFIMVACLIAGGAAAYRRERAEREAFLRGHQLEIERHSLEARVRERSRDLQARLDERESLLREIHHRVYNNQQLMLSFIQLQLSRNGDSDAARELRRTASRIRAMNLVQKRLYDTSGLPDLELNELTSHLVAAVQGEAHGVRIRLQPSDRAIAVYPDERAVTVALAVDEILWLGCEHDASACPHVAIHADARGAVVRLRIHHLAGGSDGCPDDAGLLVAQSLARQLGGECECIVGPDDVDLTIQLILPVAGDRTQADEPANR